MEDNTGGIMRKSLQYDAELKAKAKQHMPKKYLKTLRIIHHVEKPYTLYASLWVPDTPYSKIPPKLGFTLSGGGSYFRLVFDTWDEVKRIIGQINRFIVENSGQWETALDEAYEEWENLHKNIGKTLYTTPPLGPTTPQDKEGSKKETKRPPFSTARGDEREGQKNSSCSDSNLVIRRRKRRSNPCVPLAEKKG